MEESSHCVHGYHVDWICPACERANDPMADMDADAVAAQWDHDFSGSDGTAQTQTNVCKRCGFDAVKDPHRNCRVGSMA